MRRAGWPLVVAVGLAAAAAPAADTRYEVDSIGSRCIEFSSLTVGGEGAEARRCRVAESGELGTVDGETLRFAVYCLVPADAPEGSACFDGSFASRTFGGAAVAVFADAAEDVGMARLVFERAADLGRVFHRRPELHRVGDDTVLFLPVHVFGTGNLNESEYWLRRDGGWVRIESESWLRSLTAGLPDGLSIRKGVWPDLDTMRAAAALYREGDGDCCGTGGSVVAELAIEDDGFVLENVTVLPPE